MSMSLSGDAFERAVLENTVAELSADGFRVVIRPKQDTLPTSFQGCQPDVVAYKDNKNLAIDIIAGAHTASSFKLKSPVPSERFAEHPGWERRVVYARPANSDADIPVASKNTVYEHLDRLEASIDAMGVTAALLTGWSVFEAAARMLMPCGAAD